MAHLTRRWLFSFLGAIFIIYCYNSWYSTFSSRFSTSFSLKKVSSSVAKWKHAQNVRWPIDTVAKLPTGPPVSIPKIQAPKVPETAEAKELRLKRLKAVKDAMKHTWKGYRKYAWLKDEVTPIAAGSVDRFGGWAATLVDSLDTLWIMGMKGEFHEAVRAVSSIDFGSCAQSHVNVFETTIRYLGGFLAAYDLSGEPVLLEKAIELGEMLYVAFDTHNRMPVTRWRWQIGLSGMPQEAGGSAVVAEVGSLCLEFTRLAQLTGDNRFYDAIDRITRHLAEQQDSTYLPGLWPVQSDLNRADFTNGIDFSIGAMADSTYEYLPKMHMLLGGKDGVYADMYRKAVDAMNRHIFFRALNPDDREIMFPGEARSATGRNKGDPAAKSTRVYNMQHLSCFAGGMVGIGARLFKDAANERVARALTDGCIWAYESAPHGIMPEIFTPLECDRASNPDCRWNETLWLERAANWGGSAEERDGDLDAKRQFANRTHLVPGMVHARDPRYLLRPEAIESVFVMYRMTGEPGWQQHGWNMFAAVADATRTRYAHAAVEDVMAPVLAQVDNMESFWPAETLKYYYLLFSEPDLVSLDEYVLNTEAHPFRRPAPDS